jgi:anti-sigma factor RsiW
MNEDPRMPDTHPEAELASFVDGSATDQERRLVEAHLAGCAICREDVEFAARGRAAMQALPELESPG